MDVYFGVGGELLTPLDEMLDGDIKLSLELDLELKDSIHSGVSHDDWASWSSLRASPSLTDLFGEKENCIMVSPEAVMPFIKREVKHEPPPSPVERREEGSMFRPSSLMLECEDSEEGESDLEEVSVDSGSEQEEESQPEESDEEEEEEVVRQVKPLYHQVKLQPKERSIWSSGILTKPPVVKTENSGASYLSRPKTEIIVARTPASTQPPQQTVRVLHATKRSHMESSSPSSRNVVTKRVKETENGYPKPAYSYSCLIAMALKNSVTGSLPVSEIYNFMVEHFPYFKSAPGGWKNSVRHNLSLNKCFEKIEKGGANGSCRKGCLWAMNPEKITKMDDEVAKWSRKDPAAIRRAMRYPEELERLERGDLKIGGGQSLASYDSAGEEEEEESASGSGSSDSGDSETEEVPPSLKRFDSRLSSREMNDNDLGLPDEMYEELGLLEEVMSSDPENLDGGQEVKRLRLSIQPYPRAVRPV